jgi:hypothetical protein
MVLQHNYELILKVQLHYMLQSLVLDNFKLIQNREFSNVQSHSLFLYLLYTDHLYDPNVYDTTQVVYPRIDHVPIVLSEDLLMNRLDHFKIDK